MEKKRHYVGMRRFMILSSFFIGILSFFISYNKKEDASLPDKLEQMMCRTKMNVHCDPFYGYMIHYPAFFEQVPDSLIHETGCCQFYFGNLLKIAQDLPCSREWNILPWNSMPLNGGVEVIISFFPVLFILTIGW